MFNISSNLGLRGTILKKGMFYDDDDISPGITVGNSSLSDQTFSPSPDKNLSSG